MTTAKEPEKKKMTPEEKIAALVEHIKKEFPQGCREVKHCAKCAIFKAEPGTVEYDLCDILQKIEYRSN